jgi:hypothetical protein
LGWEKKPMELWAWQVEGAWKQTATVDILCRNYCILVFILGKKEEEKPHNPNEL